MLGLRSRALLEVGTEVARTGAQCYEARVLRPGRDGGWAPQAADYVSRALDPTAAPSYGVPGDE